MRPTKTRNAFRAGIAEAAEILTRRADQARRDPDGSLDEAAGFYQAAVALSLASRAIPEARINELLEREES